MKTKKLFLEKKKKGINLYMHYSSILHSFNYINESPAPVQESVARA